VIGWYALIGLLVVMGITVMFVYHSGFFSKEPTVAHSTIELPIPIVFGGIYRTMADRTEATIVQSATAHQHKPGFCRRCGWKVGGNRQYREPCMDRAASLAQAYCQSKYQHHLGA
jgi:hypothetical protein